MLRFLYCLCLLCLECVTLLQNKIIKHTHTQRIQSVERKIRAICEKAHNTLIPEHLYRCSVCACIVSPLALSLPPPLFLFLSLSISQCLYVHVHGWMCVPIIFTYVCMRARFSVNIPKIREKNALA